MMFNGNKLSEKQINVIFNLAEKLVDRRLEETTDLYEVHPISNIYKAASRGMIDIDEETEYSIMGELISNSIFNDSEDPNIGAEYIKALSVMNDDCHLGINVGKLAKYIL